MYQQVERCASMQVSSSRPGVSAQPAFKCRFAAGKRRHAVSPRAAAGNGKGGIGALLIDHSCDAKNCLSYKSRCGPILGRTVLPFHHFSSRLT